MCMKSATRRIHSGFTHVKLHVKKRPAELFLEFVYNKNSFLKECICVETCIKSGGGKKQVSVSEKCPTVIQPNVVISPSKLRESKTGQSWILLPLSWVLGLFHSAGCPPLPAVGFLQAVFCWPAAFFHTSAVCEQSCVFIPPSFHSPVLLLPCLPPTPSGGAGGSLPWQLVKSPN